MGLRDKFQSDKGAERDGAWLSIKDFDGEGEEHEICAFRIARAGGANSAYAEKLAKRSKGLQLAIEHGKVPEKVQVAIVQKVFAETCLREWRGDVEFLDGSKASETANVTDALRLFKEYPDLWVEMWGFAKTAEVYRGAVLKAAEGNS